jgi:hypothetical protein
MFPSREMGTNLVPETSENLYMGTELVPETSENLHILTRLSATEISLNSFAAKAARHINKRPLRHTNATPNRDRDQR